VLTDAGYAVAGRKRPAPPEAEGTQRMDTLDALQLLEGIPVRPGTVLGALVVALRRPQGATNLQLMVATGWQPHSVRGAISGLLRKRLGMNVLLPRNAAGEPVPAPRSRPPPGNFARKDPFCLEHPME
jgi:hypothetical protein